VLGVPPDVAETARPDAGGGGVSLFVVWAAGAVVSLLTLLTGLLRLRWIASRAVPLDDGRWSMAAVEIAHLYGLRRPVLLLQSAHPTLLVTWGVVRPKVIVPHSAPGWSDERVRIVLGHELAHIRRRDWLLHLGVQLLRAFHWFNPLVWVAARRLRQESEQACDDSVLRLGIDGPAYATHLLELARTFSSQRRMWSPAPGIARQSSLERRIRAMVNTRINREPVTRTASAAAALALLAATVVITSFTAAAQTFSTVDGVLRDQQGGLLPRATVVLTNARTQAKYEVQTDAVGQFEFIGIPAGEFTLAVRLPGFRPVEERVTMDGRDLHRDVALQIGTLEETITVTASPGERRPVESYDPEQARARLREAVERCSAAAPATGPAVGGKIRPPRKVKHVAPSYPEGLKAAGIGGTVRLDALVGVDGRVRDVTSLDGQSVDPGLVQAAVDAVNQWEFDGTLLNCVPVEVSMEVTVSFDSQR
jgi:TonB family protein